MDWAKAIEINRTALQRIVAGLIAMVGFAAGETVELLPRAVHRSVLELLRPAESAVRRLIAIMAHGLDVKPPVLRPMPAGLALSRKSSGRAIFQLHDPRKRFDWSGRRRGKPGSVPRITFFDFDPLIPLFQPATLPSASDPTRTG